MISAASEDFIGAVQDSMVNRVKSYEDLGPRDVAQLVKCLPSMHTALVQSLVLHKLSMGAHAYILNSRLAWIHEFLSQKVK